MEPRSPPFSLRRPTRRRAAAAWVWDSRSFEPRPGPLGTVRRPWPGGEAGSRANPTLVSPAGQDQGSGSPRQEEGGAAEATGRPQSGAVAAARRQGHRRRGVQAVQDVRCGGTRWGIRACREPAPHPVSLPACWGPVCSHMGVRLPSSGFSPRPRVRWAASPRGLWPARPPGVASGWPDVSPPRSLPSPLQPRCPQVHRPGAHGHQPDPEGKPEEVL